MTFFPTKTMTVTRYADGSWINGKWVNGTSSTLTIKTSWQPVRTEELQPLIEGQRIDRAYKGFTDTPLFTADAKTGNPADSITFDSDNYVVIHREVHGNGVIPHYMFIAMRVREQE